jgi:hypothetical protein
MPKAKAEKDYVILFAYTNKGFFNGLPARDMTEREWLSYPSELTKPALKQKLYVIIKVENTKEVKDA